MNAQLDRVFKAAVGFLEEGSLDARTYGKRIIWQVRNAPFSSSPFSLPPPPPPPTHTHTHILLHSATAMLQGQPTKYEKKDGRAQARKCVHYQREAKSDSGSAKSLGAK